MFETAVKDRQHDGRKLRELRWSVKPSVNLYDLYRATKIQVSVLSGIENGSVIPSDAQYAMLHDTICRLIERRLKSGEVVMRPAIPVRKRSGSVEREA